MKFPCGRLSVSVFASALAIGLFLPMPAHAQSYPTKAVRFIIPYPPGGPTDIMGRMAAQRLAEAWGVPVVPENRAGSGGSIGTELCAKSPPDGYTICMFSTGQASAPALNSKLGFDPVRDFAHVTLLATLPSLLLVHPSVPARNVKELVALAKARPGKLNYAAGSAGSSSHIEMEMFKMQSGVFMVHIPYRGTGPALIDQISGVIDVAFSTTIAAQTHVQSGRLRAIAISTKKRSPLFPDLPTVAESGLRSLKDFDAGSWQGIVMPAGTPREIVNKVNADLVKILNSSDMKERITAMGGTPAGNSPEEFTAFNRAEVEKLAKVVKDAGIRGE